jgi:hypothetical protein
MFGIDPLFAFVDGGDVGIHKHEQIARLLEEGRISTRALMIGDRDVDLFAAQRNGLESAAVLRGYCTEEELRSGNPAPDRAESPVRLPPATWLGTLKHSFFHLRASGQIAGNFALHGMFEIGVLTLLLADAAPP